MRGFVLLVAYDGTGFSGWQAQPDRRTVQGVLAEALAAVLGSPPAALTGAGRTDAGVHARGQAVSFRAATRLPARALPPLLGRALPEDVRVRSAAEVDDGFSARRSARARRYAYRLLPEPDLLLERYAWHPRRPLDPERLSRATRPLEGEHDCSAFRTAGGSPADPRCRIARASWTREGAALRFDVVADHFLYRMVRTIVGTALALSAARDPAAAMAEILASRDRGRAGAAAPAHGLCLEQVFYPEAGA